MKTALEYFIEQLDCLNIERKKNLIDAETFFKHKKILTQQARAMEKEQIIEFTNDYVLTQCNASFEGNVVAELSMEEYYELTFKSE